MFGEFCEHEEMCNVKSVHIKIWAVTVAFGFCERNSQSGREKYKWRLPTAGGEVLSDVRKAMEKLPQVYKHGFQSISVQLVAIFVF